ncbi:pentatricopeptide repeat-containing protein At1g61870, mitochondrial-like [Panicum hallii]|nr:pentatricopeptide repeat-containing protein At1g61870, mitochondrial-like [Panicum hallii]
MRRLLRLGRSGLISGLPSPGPCTACFVDARPKHKVLDRVVWLGLLANVVMGRAPPLDDTTGFWPSFSLPRARHAPNETMAAAAALCRSPSLLCRRHLLIRLLSTHTHTQLQAPPPTPTTPADLSRLKSSIRDAATTPDALAALFLSALPHPAFLADRPLFALSVRRLASAGRRDLVASILSSSLTALPSPHPSEGFLIRLIALYSAAAMPDHSLTAFRLVKPPSDRALSALLSAYHDNRLYDRVVQAFNTLPAELGIKPGLVSHNVLLKTLVASGDLAAARVLFDEMPHTAGVQPDIVSCNEILKGYLNTGDDAAFDQLLKEIAGPERHFKPNVGTYNLRMTLLCARGRSFEAEELLDAMGARGVPPNRACFNTVIKGLCNEGEVGAAMALFRKMPEVPRQNGTGVSPNFETYIMLLEALVNKGVFDPAMEICKECLRNKWAPPFQAVKGLVQGLLKSRQAKRGKEVLMAMRKVVKGDAKAEWMKVEAQLSLLLADKKA